MEGIIYGVLVLMAGLLCIFKEHKNWMLGFECYWLITEVAMTVVTIVAMNRIHSCSVMLEDLGIKKDGFVMKLYIALWVSVSVITLAVIALNIIINIKWEFHDKQDVEQMARLNIAMINLTSIQFINSILLDLVILAHYWKAGDALGKKLAESLTNSLIRTRSLES